MGDVASLAYTAICGGKDLLRHTGRVRPDEERFVCFTDVEYPVSPYLGWEIRPAETMCPSPRLNAKRHQVLPHWDFPDLGVSLYLDGTHTLKESVRVADLAAEYLVVADVAVFEHSERDCAYQEAEYCSAQLLDDPDVIQRQMARYRAEGFPEHFGLPALTMLLRRHTPRTETLNDAWWEEICRGSVRDQLSFPYVCWRLGLRWDPIPGWAYLNRYTHCVPHGAYISEGGFADVVPY